METINEYLDVLSGEDELKMDISIDTMSLVKLGGVLLIVFLIAYFFLKFVK